MKPTLCIVCGREIPELPAIPDPSLPPANDEYWWFKWTPAGNEYHVRCEGGLQLEMFA